MKTGAKTTLAEAYARHKAEDLYGAEAGYLSVLKQNPFDASALQLLGTLKAQQGYYPVAINYLRESLRLNPEDVHVQYNLGNAYAESGGIDDAIECFQRVLEIDPGFDQASLMLGRIFMSKREYSSAIEVLGATVSINRSNVEVMSLLARAMMFNDKTDDAMRVVQECLTINPNMAAALATYADLLKMQNSYPEAEAYYRRACEIDSVDESVLWRWGDLLREQGRTDEALKKYLLAVAINPEDIHCQARYGMALLETGSPGKQKLLEELSHDYIYHDASEAAALARGIARDYGYSNVAASKALVDGLNIFNPSELYDNAWWERMIDSFGAPVDAHDRILRGVISAVFSWSIPTYEVIESISRFVGDARLNSIGCGAAYWEYLLARHFGVGVVASDKFLKHRFMPVDRDEYATAAIAAEDVVFLGWIPRGVGDSTLVLERMQAGQRLILAGESPDQFGVAQTCATDRFHQWLREHFRKVGSVNPARFRYFRDKVGFYVKH